MSDPATPDWIVCQVGSQFYAIKRDFSELYDPLNLSMHTAQFNMKTPMTKEKAKAMVDRMNAKGAPKKVDGRRRSLE